MTGTEFFQEEPAHVFISYRNLGVDAELARNCAGIIESVAGLTPWIDQADDCLERAASDQIECEQDRAIAGCIERGLDMSAALLGIIGPQTFTSPWIAYEIGSARGRQKFTKPFQERYQQDEFPCPAPNPLIAHLIHRDVKKPPAFLTLGTPLFDREDVRKWACGVARILRRIGTGTSRSVLLQMAHRPDDSGVNYLNYGRTLSL